MARIRTIKPEFPLSESIGRLSRDARLLYIMLWTVADDSGRARAASRLLASLLFPYDDDAPGLIDGWLEELEGEQCITRYQHDGVTYLEILNWRKHQKIDKPTPSRLPEAPADDDRLATPREDSTSPREDSMVDLGPRTKDQGPRTKDQEPPLPPKGDGKWQPVVDWCAAQFGKPAVYGARGKPYAHVGKLLRAVGPLVDANPDRAVKLLTEYQQSGDWQYVNVKTLHERVVKWHTTNTTRQTVRF